jgi:hypothetical protein
MTTRRCPFCERRIVAATTRCCRCGRPSDPRQEPAVVVALDGTPFRALGAPRWDLAIPKDRLPSLSRMERPILVCCRSQCAHRPAPAGASGRPDVPAVPPSSVCESPGDGHRCVALLPVHAAGIIDAGTAARAPQRRRRHGARPRPVMLMLETRSEPLLTRRGETQPANASDRPPIAHPGTSDAVPALFPTPRRVLAPSA